MNTHRVGEKIKNVREWRNYTQKYMADQLGIKQNTYSLWEKGKGLTEEGVESIAGILDIPANELLSSDSVVLTMNHNRANGNNGYVNIQNQQNTVPQELLESILQENRERAKVLEDLVRSQMELLKEVMGRKK